MRNFYKILLSLCLLSKALSAAPYRFYSSKPWEAFRWYVVGSLSKNSIQFLGNRAPISFPATCAFDAETFEVRREFDLEHLEILRDRDLILIEIDPMSKKERILLASNSSKECRHVFLLEFSDSELHTGSTPYLFSTPNSTKIGKNEIVILSPVSKQLDEKVTLNILAGYSLLQLPNAQSGASTRLQFFPIIQARGVWTPSFFPENWSLALELSENVFSFGQTSFQSLRHSDIFAKGAYRFLLSKSFQSTIGLGYGKHSSNDGSLVRSVSPYLRNIQMPSIDSSIEWLSYPLTMGLRLRAIIPNPWQYGVTQSAYETRLWTAFNYSERLDLLLEFQYKLFQAESASAESFYGLHGGLSFRL